MSLRVLTWNLFHGRSLPPSRTSLQERFTRMLAGWDWDVAMLQEVPPWWPPALAAACGASAASALTSRNWGLPLRRAIAERRPDAIKSNGGGANAILVRPGAGGAAEAWTLRLRLWPERRVAQAVRLGDGTLVAGYHGSARAPLARQELARLWEWAGALAAGAPLVLGGDLNLRDPAREAPPGALHAARRDVDHQLALGFRSASAEVLERRVELPEGALVELSDHPPLLARLDGSQEM